MTWNWHQDDWPNFTYEREALAQSETRFIHEAGMVHGAIKHLTEGDKSQLTIDLISNEAVTTSEIEGEILNRDSVQSSIRRNFGLDTDNRKIPLAEQGIAALMSDLYQHAGTALSEEQLFGWHTMLMCGQKDLTTIGTYRTTQNPMQVVSGAIGTPKIHFEAPPSHRVSMEMNRFLAWFNHTAAEGPQPLPALARASIAHLYFESIHPFEDGNGRIGRALSEKALSQSLGRPTLIALSQTICRNRKAYYKALEDNNKALASLIGSSISHEPFWKHSSTPNASSIFSLPKPGCMIACLGSSMNGRTKRWHACFGKDWTGSKADSVRRTISKSPTPPEPPPPEISKTWSNWVHFEKPVNSNIPGIG